MFSSDVIKNFVFEDKAKDKDMEPEDEDKNLQKQQGQRWGQGLFIDDKAKDKDLEPRPRQKKLKAKTNDLVPICNANFVRVSDSNLFYLCRNWGPCPIQYLLWPH